MSTLSKVCVAVAGMFAFAAPAAAQTFEGEIDCGGVVMPGDSVPFALRFEEQAFQQHTIAVQVTLTGPGINKTLITKTFNLNPNQDLTINRVLNLKPNAPNGSYQLQLFADDGSQTQSDTCSFNVN
jgi:hypothetical protein